MINGNNIEIEDNRYTSVRYIEVTFQQQNPFDILRSIYGHTVNTNARDIPNNKYMQNSQYQSILTTYFILNLITQKYN